MYAFTGYQNATTEQFVCQVSISMPHVKDIIIKGVDKRTHVLLSMTSDEGKNEIKKLKLEDPPALCIHLLEHHFMVVIDENGDADGIGRFRDLTLLQRQEKNVFKVEGTYFLGISCTDEESTRFLSIPTKDDSIIKKLLKHFKEMYDKDTPIHLKIQVPHIKVADVVRRMPERMNFASLSLSGQRATRKGLKKISDRGRTPPVYVHANMEQVDGNPEEFWRYDIVHIQNAYWIEGTFLNLLESKILILENPELRSSELHLMFMSFMNYPDNPVKCWIVTLRDADQSFEQSVFSRAYTFLPYDGERRPTHFEMPTDLQMYIPEKWRRINLAQGQDYVQNDGKIVTRLNSGRTLIIVKW